MAVDEEMRIISEQSLPAINFSEAERCRGDISPENLEQAVKLFRSAGCLVVENVFPLEFIATLHTSFLTEYAFYLKARKFPDALMTGDKRIMVTVAFKSPFNTPLLYAPPLLYPLIRGILYPTFILNNFGCVVALPGAPAQHIHRDGGQLFSQDFDCLLPCYAVTVITALIDLNELNGTTRVYPGSHRSSNQGPPLSMNYRDPLIPAGSCLLMDYRLLHGGTPTLSEQPRPILYTTYSRPWYRDYANFTHTNPKQRPLQIHLQEYEKVPEEFRPLFAAAIEK